MQKKEKNLDSDDELDRGIMWKSAHIPKDGSLDDDLKPVVEKIVSTFNVHLNKNMLLNSIHEIRMSKQKGELSYSKIYAFVLFLYTKAF